MLVGLLVQVVILELPKSLKCSGWICQTLLSAYVMEIWTAIVINKSVAYTLRVKLNQLPAAAGNAVCFLLSLENVQV
jgi:hypothetical protein